MKLRTVSTGVMGLAMLTVLGTGCDLPQETPVENIRAFVRAGREYRVQAPA